MEAVVCYGTDNAALRYKASRTEHWNHVAQKLDRRRGWGVPYHRRLTEIYQSLIPTGQRVLEIGCGQGDLLAALRPSVGVGVDFSAPMLARAEGKHPDLHFVHADAHDLDLDETFDFIILSDLVNDLWDVQSVLMRLANFAHPATRVILNTRNYLWGPLLRLGNRAGLVRKHLRQNWLTVDDLANLLQLSGFETLRSWQEILWPLATPLVAGVCNKFLVKMFPWNHLAMCHFLIARPSPAEQEDAEPPTVSIIVPARNEAGNIEQIVARTPELGAGTELVFVEGHSTDDTYDAIGRAIVNHPERSCVLLKQDGKGKADAVRKGFEHATGDILMILDADISVVPEDLVRFYEAIRSGRGEFINGVRLVYPMENKAMRFLNLLGNKFFSIAFSWMLGVPVKDTLCGTKVLWKKDYDLIAANRAYFGDFDPFGDFDLLFGAAKLNKKIVDLPVRYRERTYGATNIQRWKHGWMLLNMVLFAANKIKFI
jgi:SAM-dependent methyltransferase